MTSSQKLPPLLIVLTLISACKPSPVLVHEEKSLAPAPTSPSNTAAHAPSTIVSASTRPSDPEKILHDVELRQATALCTGHALNLTRLKFLHLKESTSFECAQRYLLKKAPASKDLLWRAVESYSEQTTAVGALLSTVQTSPDHPLSAQAELAQLWLNGELRNIDFIRLQGIRDRLLGELKTSTLSEAAQSSETPPAARQAIESLGENLLLRQWERAQNSMDTLEAFLAQLPDQPLSSQEAWVTELFSQRSWAEAGPATLLPPAFDSGQMIFKGKAKSEIREVKEAKQSDDSREKPIFSISSDEAVCGERRIDKELERDPNYSTWSSVTYQDSCSSQSIGPESHLHHISADWGAVGGHQDKDFTASVSWNITATRILPACNGNQRDCSPIVSVTFLGHPEKADLPGENSGSDSIIVTQGDGKVMVLDHYPSETVVDRSFGDTTIELRMNRTLTHTGDLKSHYTGRNRHWATARVLTAPVTTQSSPFALLRTSSDSYRPIAEAFGLNSDLESFAFAQRHVLVYARIVTARVILDNPSLRLSDTERNALFQLVRRLSTLARSRYASPLKALIDARSQIASQLEPGWIDFAILKAQEGLSSEQVEQIEQQARALSQALIEQNLLTSSTADGALSLLENLEAGSERDSDGALLALMLFKDRYQALIQQNEKKALQNSLEWAQISSSPTPKVNP